MKKTNNLVKLGAWGLMIFALGVGAGASFVDMNRSASDSSTKNVVANPEDVSLDLFWEVWHDMDKDYVYEDVADADARVYGAIKGLVHSFQDPFTEFMDPAETENFDLDLNQELSGIGAQLNEEEGLIVIVSPLKGSPAEAAGVRSGDIIYKIDGELATNYSLFEAVDKIRGEAGTKVVLTLLREGQAEPLELEITRDIIKLDSVTTEQLENQIMYIAVNRFSEDTNTEFTAAAREALLADNMGIILDLRYNGGGYLDKAVDLLNELLEPGEIAVQIDSRNQDLDETIYTNGSARLAGLPMVVLINEGSASASEIVAGALKDHGAAYLIGKQSFGKGSVQQILRYTDGSSLRITVASWKTPNGTDLNKEGIVPDEEIDITNEDIESEIDRQKDRAVQYLIEQING